MKHTVLLGAFDRYNYGDILFPRVLEHEIRKQYSEKEMKLTFCGLIEADLTAVGGYETQAISKVLEEEHIDNIIIVGGDVLGANFTSILSCLYCNYLTKILQFIRLSSRKIGFSKGKYIADYFSSMYLDSQYSMHPRIVPKKDSYNIFYNSIGGELLDYINYGNLFQAQHISVRDKRTLKSIRNGIGLNATLSPDSASIMSDIFNFSCKEHIYEGIVNFINHNKEYIAIQFNYLTWIKNKEVLCSQIINIYNNTKLPFALVPIGYALGHEDDIALNSLSLFLETNHIPHFNPSIILKIIDIMFLISQSSLYIGTSLHGAITAMSYSVAVIGLTKNISKLDSYLKTRGGVIYNQGSTAIEDLFLKTIGTLNNSQNYNYSNLAKDLKYQSYTNLSKIISLL